MATGLCVDGLGITTVGANAAQSSCVAGDSSQEWAIVGSAGYVRIQNRASGLFLDGMGRTSNGSELGQYVGDTSTNQQCALVSAS